MYYFERKWNEPRFDEHEDWGTSVWYFETEAAMCVNRQIEVYANGTVLRYDRQHLEDAYGDLHEWPLDAASFAPFAITQETFERVWESHRPIRCEFEDLD